VAAFSSACACCRVRGFDGRPGCPVGVSHSRTTLRLTLSRAWARAIERARIDLIRARVPVLSVRALAASHWSTSSAESSCSLRWAEGGDDVVAGEDPQSCDGGWVAAAETCRKGRFARP
jgi:hypothetical protein